MKERLSFLDWCCLILCVEMFFVVMFLANGLINMEICK